jgi:hypothetical protein
LPSVKGFTFSRVVALLAAKVFLIRRSPTVIDAATNGEPLEAARERIKRSYALAAEARRIAEQTRRLIERSKESLARTRQKTAKAQE